MPDPSTMTWGALALTTPPEPPMPSWNRRTTPLRLITHQHTARPDHTKAPPAEARDAAVYDKPLQQDAHDDAATRAQTVLTYHLPTPTGLCAGCLHLYGHLKPHPCETANWAAAVLTQPVEGGAHTP